MTTDPQQDTPPVTGDPVLINVLAAAQRFAAWYAEYLSAGANPPSAANDTAEAMAQEQRAEDLVQHLQHAVFDLMAAVHEMNRHCTGDDPAREGQRSRPLSLVRAAIH